MKFLIFFTALFFTSFQAQAQEVDFGAIEAELKGEGLGGWVHGAFKEESLFVFTWRHPDNFFVNVQLPMIAASPAVRESLANVRRHDFLVIKGFFATNDAPIQHLIVREVVSIKEWTGIGSEIEYEHSTKIPDELLNQTEMVGTVSYTHLTLPTTPYV